MKLYKYPLLLFFLCLVLTGCKKEQSTETISKNSVSINELSEDTTDIYHSKDEFANLDLSDVPDVTNMTRQQFKALSIDDIKKIAASIGDYRSVYKIRSDYIMEEKDWEKLKDIMELQLFGVPEKSQYEKDVTTIKGLVSENDAMYLAPDISYLQSLSVDEFADWFNEACKYFANGWFNSESVNLHDLTKEEILQIKDSYIKMLQEMEEGQ